VSSELDAVTFDAHEPQALGRFWAGVLDRTMSDDSHDDAVTLLPNEDPGFRIDFVRSQEMKVGQNRIHFDLTSTSVEDQQAIVQRVLDLGGRHIDVGQLPDEGHIVLADPEGNEFCVIEPGNNFLADTALIGAINCDGSQAVGRFWSEALGWPLVWDQDEETAIQSPRGGSKIAWGGPPVAPKTGKARLHIDLRATGDLQVEVDRLISLGAKHADIGQRDVAWVVLADPDDNEFCVLPARG
jgi:predicted enzyme related to lactoylglutathione lyase